ncbi:hypothetical protein BH10BAC5_BH10BAC5_25320 [soil metagenome]
MKKYSIIILLFIACVGSACNKRQNGVPETKQVVNVHKKYWVNASTYVIHNESCKWYWNTKNGFYSDTFTGKSCYSCGGCK